MIYGEKAARRRCKQQGYDPDFVGSKNYPNWHDYMYNAIKKRHENMVKMVASIAKRSDNSYVKDVSDRLSKAKWNHEYKRK